MIVKDNGSIIFYLFGVTYILPMSKEVDIIVIKKCQNQPSHQISMRLPLETTFQQIVNFLSNQGFLNSKNAVVRPHHNPVYVIGMQRKISDCYNIIELKFIVEEPNNKNLKMTNVQALRTQKYTKQTLNKQGNCGNCNQQNCIIM